jgi:hypothetical protein
LGEPTKWITDRVLKEINKDSGIYIKERGKNLPVKVKILYTESNLNKSADVASRLIMGDRIDFMLVMYTPDVGNPVSGICERFEMLCVCLGVPDCETPLVGGQWVKGKKWPLELELTNSGKFPEIRQTADMVFPLPKSS